MAGQHQNIDAIFKSALALVKRKGPEYVLDHISSLPTEVPCAMKLKYLLLVLKKERIAEAGDILKKYNVQGPSSILKNVSFKDLSFGIEQLSDLNELLVEYAHKWKSIGIALGFKPRDLNNIQACPTLLSEAPNSYLTKVLEEWLLQKFKYTQPPTKNYLKSALCSRTVGLGKLAKEVAEINVQSSAFKSGSSYSLITLSFWDKTTEISCRHVVVKEGAGTLLEVGVIPSVSKYSPSYSWSISDNRMALDYRNSSLPTLYVTGADIDIDGCKFLCKVWLNSVVLDTPPVLLQVSCPLDEYKVDLTSVYLAQPEVPEDTWPPVGNKKYITLALIKQQQVNYCSEYARFTIRGDIDDILQHKQIIVYDGVFRSLKSGQLVFIEGRPGSGKTTFVHKLAQDWAKSSNGGIRLLLLVSLRVLNTFFRPDLSDILKLFRNLKVSRTLIEERDGKGVCFIFDGFDEFSPMDGEKSIVYEIINRKYLTKSTVVVASRPAAIARLRQRANKVIEVLGFMSEHILEYFNYYPFSNKSKAISLKKYLLFHPNIFHMCYLPIHAAMIAHLFEVTGKVPKTETEIYSHFTHFTLKRSLTKIKPTETEYTGINNLSGVERQQFRQICRLAWEKTLLNKQVLRQDEVSSYFQVRKDGDTSLGLITVDRTAGLYGYKDIYTFLHLTFQEYLAAYHVFTLSDKEQIKLIQEHGGKNHMLVVWKFYCGLIEIKPYEDKFKSILKSTEGNTFFHIQCAYESQEKIACAQLLKTINYHIRLENEYTRIPDFTAIGFLMNISVLPLKLSLLNCNVDVEAIDGLLSEIKDKSELPLASLHVETNDTDLECIKKLVTNAPSLKQFFLGSLSRKANNPVDVSFVWSTNITELSIVNVNIKPDMLMNRLYFENLRTLNLSGSLKGSYRGFFMFLQHSKNLKELNVSNNCIDIEGAKVLGESLRSCTTLMILNLSESIKSGFMAVFESLQRFKELKELNVSNNCIDIQEAKVLAESLRSCTTLTILNLSGSIKSSFMALFECLHSESLKELNVSNNCINETGAKVLAESLRCFTSLETIIIRDNNLQRSGIVAVLTSIQHCSLRVKEEEIVHQRNYKFSGIDILRCLQCSSNLQSLEVSINEEDVHFFCLERKGWSELKELRLYQQKKVVSFWVIQKISLCLQHFKQLQILVLKNCMTKGQGVKDLMSSLRQCSNLQVLDLSDNQIRPEEFKSILGGLEHLVNLKELFLADNEIGNVGAKFLSSHCQNLLLCKLDIQNNGISSEAISALKSSINHCSSLVLNC